RVPRSAVAPLVPQLDDQVMKRIPGESRLFRLLVSYVTAIVEHRLLDDAEGQAIVVRHAHDLVALVAGATGNAATIAAMRGLRGARLRAIKADIAANLANCGLTVASIAAGRGVSSRYVHKLFEPTGSTFSQFVLEQRLSRAYRVLSERRFDDQPISAIAF